MAAGSHRFVPGTNKSALNAYALDYFSDVNDVGCSFSLSSNTGAVSKSFAGIATPFGSDVSAASENV